MIVRFHVLLHGERVRVFGRVVERMGALVKVEGYPGVWFRVPE